MTEYIRHTVQNDERLLSVFGEWPTFHDAEVLNVHMDREEPAIVIRVYVFVMSREIDDAGCFRRTRNTIVTLAFHKVSEVALEDFNQQNVLAELTIIKRDQDDLEVLLYPIFGVGGRIVCAWAEVAEVSPSGDMRKQASK